MKNIITTIVGQFDSLYDICTFTPSSGAFYLQLILTL